jgi:hypothetical protein
MGDVPLAATAPRFPAFSLKAHLQTLYQLCRHTYSATPNAGLVRLRSPNAPQRPDFGQRCAKAITLDCPAMNCDNDSAN